MRGVAADSEPEPMLARHPGPCTNNVFLRPDAQRIPRVVRRIAAVEVVVVVRQADEIFRSCLYVQLHQLFRLPCLGFPQAVDLHDPESGRVPVMSDVVVVLWLTLPVHLPRIPVALLRNALRRPMGPDPKFCIAEPIWGLVLLERFPVRLEGASFEGALRVRLLPGLLES